MSKKIAFIGPLPPPIGGVAQANLRVQKVILKHFKEYEVINFNTSKGTINADLYKSKGFKELWHAFKNIIGLTVFSLKNKIYVSNVFVVPNISFLREAVFIFLLKLTSKRVAVHLHAKVKGDYFLSGLKLKFFTKIISLADVVFVLSEDYHKNFYKKYINPNKLVVLENFIDVEEFENDSTKKSSNCLYVGRLSEKKGFLTLIKAVSMIKNQIEGLKIHVLGAFENKAFEETCLNLIQLYQLDNFIFYGPITGNEKIKFFKENSVFLFPSYFENSPIVLKEATAAKMAIIAAEIEENKMVLEGFNNILFFTAKDEYALADKIQTLFHNKPLLRKLIKNSCNAEIFDENKAKTIIKMHLLH